MLGLFLFLIRATPVHHGMSVSREDEHGHNDHEEFGAQEFQTSGRNRLATQGCQERGINAPALTRKLAAIG